MQLMPRTWLEMRAAHGLGTDPHDPRDNILAGAAYLRLMYDRFGYPGLFAAYNAGPARYAAHLRDGRDLPGETRTYVARIAGSSAPPASILDPAPVRPVDGLFVPLSRAIGQAGAAPTHPSRLDPRLFAPVASDGTSERAPEERGRDAGALVRETGHGSD